MFICSYIFFNDYMYVNIDLKKCIDIDNEFNASLYEKEMTFKKYNTNFKPIAFYHPEYNNISFFNFFNNSFKKDINNIHKLIKKQIKLAKNHQIYGFAIYYDPFYKNNISIITTYAFLNKFFFPFFIVLKIDKIKNINIIVIDFLIIKLSKFMLSDNYIKIKERPILSINCPYNLINETNFISLLRSRAKKFVGKIYLLYPFKGKLNNIIFINKFDAIYDFSQLDLYDEINRPNIIHYTGFIYKNLILNNINYNCSLYRSIFVNYYYFKDYKPEKFYFQNKIIFQSLYNKYFDNEKIIFIESWNDYLNGNYLEFDEKFGFSTINSFSKSILNLPYNDNKIIINDSFGIAIQVHVVYEKLFKKLLSKINRISFKYDLYISTISKEKMINIEKMLIKSNDRKYEIKIFENKGSDIYPFISQMRNIFKYYKYICHLHTNKTMYNKHLGLNWIDYIYKNLIGSNETFSNIIFDFEENKLLGFIFPEAYYELIRGVKDYENSNYLVEINKLYMNFILKRFFHKYKVGNQLIFPVGNMFWAKTKAIYQIFDKRFKFEKRLMQASESILYAIERIWLYLVKFNGYFYKKIINHY